MEEKEKHKQKDVKGSRASVQPERWSSLVDRNIADNVQGHPFGMSEK